MDHIRIAVAGNPNVGKTTLLNAITGSHQRVGNWPGVTVERIEGEYNHNGTHVEVTDLPGIYSFAAFSMDETIARQFILTERPDLIVNILDASNLERNLFLTTQLLEMKVPMIVALNMTDVAEKRQIRIEIDHLSEHLGCPVIPIVASSRKGITELKDEINAAVARGDIPNTQIHYDSVLEQSVGKIGKEVRHISEVNNVDNRWLALKLLEEDTYAAELCGNDIPDELLKSEITYAEKHVGNEMDIILADGRYGFIHGLVKDVVNRPTEMRITASDKIDRVILNRILGIPIFFAIMFAVFITTINFGSPFIDFFDKFTGTVFIDGFRVLLLSMNSPDWLIVFLAEGVGGGIQTVSTFIPPIFLIFLCLSLLEDSGYMARAAFVTDSFLRKIGLPGKAFIPMLVGFGCNVPAILATRTLENDRDRILAIMMNPFMSCGARLPVYTIFVTAFFSRYGGAVLFSIYAIGILLAVGTGLLFKKTILKGEVSTFVMELPPYHLPTFRGIMYHTLTRLKSFLLRAGRIIIIFVILLSTLSSMGTDGSFGNTDSDNSVLSAIGKKIVPVFAPMGIESDNWPAAVGFLSGIFAKETVVSTLDNLYSSMESGPDTRVEEKVDFNFKSGIVDAFKAIPEGFSEMLESDSPTETANAESMDGNPDLSGTTHSTVEMIQEHFGGPISGFAYILFILIYVPCIAVVATIYRETNWKWATLSTAYLTILAWIISTLFYQIGTFSAHPTSGMFWISIALALLAGVIGMLKLIANSGKLKPDNAV